MCIRDRTTNSTDGNSENGDTTTASTTNNSQTNTNQSSNSTSAGSTTYTVQSGDTYWGIATKVYEMCIRDSVSYSSAC